MDRPTLRADLSRLTRLVHHRWNIPVIATLHRHAGAKFVTLMNGLQVSRGSLSTSLSHLAELGLVKKNDGHGHPMRPEYILTQRGHALGYGCCKLMDALCGHDESELAFRKWTLPLVVAIGPRNIRFNELRSSLCDATPRAIAIGLRSLLQNNWADRRLIDEFPPTAGYELRPQGRRILTHLNYM